MESVIDMGRFLDTMNNKPALTIAQYKTSGTDDIASDLCSRQVVNVPLDKVKFLQLLPGFVKDMYLAIDKNATAEDFSQLIDASDICEYHCPTDYFSVSKGYMTYIKMGDAQEFTINVYGAEKAANIPDILKPHIIAEIPELPNLQREIPAKMNYPKFESDSYNVIQDPAIENNIVYVLNTNLPYKYYSKIPVMYSTYSYDINNKAFHFFDLNEEEAIEKFNTMIAEKSLPGIYVSIRDNKINPINFANLYILMAKFYKLPYIPASLLVTGMSLPFLEKTLRDCSITAAETNEVCDPYFVFTDRVVK
jgi:hypothetical protein